MRYSQSEKLEVIRLVEASDTSVSRTLKELGIARSTFYEWYKRYQEAGYEGLTNRSSQPRQTWNRIPDEVREQVAVVKPPEFNRFAHGFAHIFAGGYAAGYYGYKWAEVLSADAFSLFEEQGVFDRNAGASFLHHILEQGGSRDAMELFVAFRGREPRIDALLRHNGIAA